MSEPSAARDAKEPPTAGATGDADPGPSAGGSPTARPGTGPATGSRLVTLALVIVLLLAAVGVVAYELGATTSAYAGQVRQYYIAADPVEWNYTPVGSDLVDGTPFSDSSVAVSYTAHNATYLGSTFEKCIYQQFTDGTFLHLEARSSSEAYLGLLGPIIYAEVGDTVKVDFVNHCSLPESIHPQGLDYAPSSSGIPYNGSGPEGVGGAVPPGGSYNYTWSVPAEAGPGPEDGSSILWTYGSGAQPLNGTDTGLVGAIIVSAQGRANPDGSPSNVQQNVVILENIFNEGNSPYLAYNIAHDALDPGAVNPGDPLWQASLEKFTINGYLYGNMPPIDLTWGESVRWYLFSEDTVLHTVQWSGGPVSYMGTETDTVPLVPETMGVANMDPQLNGTWIVGSGESNDVLAGMQELYTVGLPSTVAVDHVSAFPSSTIAPGGILAGHGSAPSSPPLLGGASAGNVPGDRRTGRP